LGNEFNIYKHTEVSGNVQRKKGKKKEKGENLKDARIAPTRRQKLSMSTTDLL
jgi:hypothetical protein